MKECRNCHCEISENADHCPHCGVKNVIEEEDEKKVELGEDGETNKGSEQHFATRDWVEKQFTLEQKKVSSCQCHDESKKRQDKKDFDSRVLFITFLASLSLLLVIIAFGQYNNSITNRTTINNNYTFLYEGKTEETKEKFEFTHTNARIDGEFYVNRAYSEEELKKLIMNQLNKHFKSITWMNKEVKINIYVNDKHEAIYHNGQLLQAYEKHY